MINIPTDLLRTFVSVVDLRSFTRAAQSLGVTQPAVSAQIKRLQMLLDVEVFDKSAPGVTLTARGEVIVNYARRLLALNDQMIDVTARGNTAARRRIGLAVDYFEGKVLHAIAEFRRHHPDTHMQICADHSVSLLRDLRRGDYDLVVAAWNSDEEDLTQRRWLEPSAWAVSPQVLEADGPLPLIVVGESNLSRRLSVATLEQAGVDYEIVYVAGSFSGLVQAVTAGLGVACWARRLLLGTGVHVLDSGRRLPKVADVYGGVHLREGLADSALNELADMIAAAIGGANGYEDSARRAAAR